MGTRRVGEFYDERERVFQLYNTMNALAEKDPYAAEKFVDEHQQELATYGAVNATLQQLEYTRAHKRYLNGPAKDDMSKEEREDQMLQVRKLEVGLTGWLREAKTELRRTAP